MPLPLIIPVALTAGAGIAGSIAGKGLVNLKDNYEWNPTKALSAKKMKPVPAAEYGLSLRENPVDTSKAVAKVQPTILEGLGKTEEELINPKPSRKPAAKATSIRPSRKRAISNMLTGTDVAALQKQMNEELGTNLVVDGKWGPKTEATWEAYKAKMAAAVPSEGLAVQAWNSAVDQLPYTETVEATRPTSWLDYFRHTPESQAAADAERAAIVNRILGGSGSEGLAVQQYGR